MIDTGKYEGHSEGKWYWSPDGLRCETHLVYPSHRNILWNGTPPHTPKDMKLIADTPLLLQEVKRLQEMEVFVNWVKNTHPHYYHSLMTAWGGKHE